MITAFSVAVDNTTTSQTGTFLSVNVVRSYIDFNSEMSELTVDALNIML